jgi:hypothetical protein
MKVFPNAKAPPFKEAIEETIEWFVRYGNRIVNGPKVLD